MSSANQIIIEISSDDDEQDDHNEPINQNIQLDNSDSAAKRISVENKHVQIYMEVTGMSEDMAISQLLKFNQNLELCIADHFERVAPVNNKEQVKYMKIDKDTKHPSGLVERKVNAKNSVETDCAMLYEPSMAWNEIMARCNALQVKFVDPDFQANSTSLDGRRQQSQSQPVEGSTKTSLPQPLIIKCSCGVPACVRTVQKDGPNYGRFYLACGKPRPSRYRRNSKRKRESNGNDDIIIIDDDASNKATKDSVARKAQELENFKRQCQFFKWDDNHAQSNHLTRNRSLQNLMWFRFEAKHGYSLTGRNGRYSPDHVQQGATGNCWFLSALAVVAERAHLIQRLLPHNKLNEVGCYEVFFCLDGRWKGTLVDSLLPAIARKMNSSMKMNSNAISGTVTKRGGVQINDNVAIQPAFAAGNISWPALIEKAYAKIHGSYSLLNGGFISEAFYDLTGAPVERICFEKEYDYDELFARLLSFSKAGFLMGIATFVGGDGLVPCHAYSLLSVHEIYDAAVGEQKKMTQFFTNEGNGTDNDVIFVKESRQCNDTNNVNGSTRTVRLVRIRNPWGVREWKGKWSAKSEEWTSKIRRDIGDDICKQGDGTFFMSYEDMIQRFDHMDVAKCQEVSEHAYMLAASFLRLIRTIFSKQGWKMNSRGGAMKIHETRDPLHSCSLVYICEVKLRTWAFISLVQRKKRSNATTQFWYTDFSIIVFKRKRGREWERYQCLLQGVRRACDCELFLDPLYEYCFLPFSFMSGKQELEFGAQAVQTMKSAPFHFTTYSANDIDVRAQVRSSIGKKFPVATLHTFLLQMPKNVSHSIGPNTVVITANGNGCIYFIVVNGGCNGIILKLQVELKRGMAIVSGENNSTHIIPPKTESIALVITNDGRSPLPAVVNFNYKTDSAGKQSSTHQNNYTYRGIESNIPLSLAGELLCSSAGPKFEYKCGKGSIDERL